MLARLAAAVLLCGVLVACKETAPPGNTTGVQGIGDVRVIASQIVPSGDSSGQTSGGTLNYLVARVEFTNDTGTEIVPTADRFYLIDQNGNRYAGQDSGSSVFTGISNPQTPMKKDEKRELTVGFRTPNANTSGTIGYER
ncbi:MAG TPA: hypothetical protein VGN14_03775 [Candidatus Elarobacter sp.]